MSTESPSTEEQLYGIFLMGLLWLRQARPDKLAQRGSSVVASFVRAGFLPASAKALIEQSYNLMELTIARSDVIIDNRYPRRQELDRLIETSDKHNIILAISDDLNCDYGKLFSPQGYSHVITTRGMEYASHIAPQYAALINYERFVQGWELFKAQMKNLHATQGTTKSSAEPVQSDSSRYIPPAPVRSEDYMWE